ncbi:1-acyl-sn-glycerol-3-phosphate acyltransferase [Piscinibacter sp.]|uniref:1-acyl-sn-glycerol-3-phosphate acyltransferase n=1 Tax=Piscinibacter sp. TaxID=1903157 RepID=UPI002590B480|nr:1-acyl-sn-glycerol-3-phosphate acyltransferase [Piscinibacter sp.]
MTERPVQLRGSALARALLRLAGWRILFDGLPAAQGVAIVYPHTSNWDFVVGLLAKWGIGIPVTFWGKDSLFRIPLLGRWMRWLGGVPVDRASAHGIVGQMAQSLRDARRDGRFLWLALAPEGTRKHTDGWRSGFYHVAVAAQVPLGLVCLDFARREVGFKGFLALGGDREADLAAIGATLGSCTGLRPAQASPIRLKP